jgi:hypothetical protein
MAAGAGRADVAGRRLRVVETAGLRRFGYPVSTVLQSPGTGPEAHFRLSRDGKAVPAQFRRVTGTHGEPAVALDFNVSMGPRESQVYNLAIGTQVPAKPEPSRGLQVVPVGNHFRVSGTGMTYEVPGDLAGFLARVDGDRKEFVRRGSPGFWLRSNEPGAGDGGEPRIDQVRGTIQRQGPLAVGLRFEGGWPLAGRGTVPVMAALSFPASKSWVEVEWAVKEAAAGRVAEMGLDLDLAIDGEPTLVDLGARGTVYGTIRGSERLVLAADPKTGWQVSLRSGETTVIQALSRDPHEQAEGWAHVMDATRCTAVALADFGRQAHDRIEIAASGRVRLSRTFPANPVIPRSLHAWFHFVPTPVQVGAVTSPQSMLAPLRVEWI